tara:strand:+ start:940 stop:1611 length:672 start_codon:yes stop_codon:yes gene_type:complete
MSIVLLVFTLNEIDGFKKIMPYVKREWVDDIIVVDGGSTDGTIEEAERQGFKIIHQKNKGHGGAIVTGMENTNHDAAIFFGPDGNHEPEEIPRLIKKFEEGYDQVLISRFGKGSINDDANFIEWFGNKMFVFLANAFFCGNYTDTLNESRIISRKAYEELNFNALKMDSTQQLSIRGLIKKQKIVELVGNEPARVGGKKKMRPLPVGASLSWQIIREFFVWKF